MKDEDKTKAQLIAELKKMKQRVNELEQEVVKQLKAIQDKSTIVR